MGEEIRTAIVDERPTWDRSVHKRESISARDNTRFDIVRFTIKRPVVSCLSCIFGCRAPTSSLDFSLFQTWRLEGDTLVTASRSVKHDKLKAKYELLPSGFLVKSRGGKLEITYVVESEISEWKKVLPFASHATFHKIGARGAAQAVDDLAQYLRSKSSKKET